MVTETPWIQSSMGRLEQDIVVGALANSTHVLNAVSPGWTSAIPFGRWIAKENINF
jgi:hypothetical protein